MKIFAFFSLLLSFVCHASVETEYKNLVSSIQSKNNLCKDQVTSVLNKAYWKDENAADGEEYYKFVKNEQEAIKFVKALDLNKLTFEENSKIKEFLYKNCSTDINLDDFKPCDYFSDLFAFHQGLAFAVKNYPWSQKSKIESVQQIQKYLKVVSEAETLLLDKSMAILLLKDLAEKGFLEEKNKVLIKDLKRESEQLIEKNRKSSREELKTFDAGRRTCGSAFQSFQDEIAQAKRLGLQFQEVLKNTVFSNR